MATKGSVPKVKDSRKFEILCDAGKRGKLHVGAEFLSVQLGQRILRNGKEEIWHSIGIYAKEDEQGSLVVRVLVSNPDWDEPLQIASITSRPGDIGCQTALGCDLNHVTG